MKIIAVIITYNRLGYLKKCVEAVCKQSQPPAEIIVINNGSKDDTQQWLSGQPVITYTIKQNQGASAAFSLGIKMAYQHNADWIWLLDDDTIPNLNALELLQAPLGKFKAHNEKIGFLVSNVLWTDGSPHKMCRAWPIRNEKTRSLFPFLLATPYSLIKWGTFNSMLLSAKAVEKVGLPIKEFFIWGDDVEYSTRIIKNGMAGISVPESIVIHETSTNHESNVFKDPPYCIPKHRYGLRNELYMRKVYAGKKAFWRLFMRRMIIWPIHIMKRRKSNKWAYMKVVWIAGFNAINFRPNIEFVEKANKLE